MSFVWPQMLFALAILPLLAGFYVWRQRSARAANQTLSGLSGATTSGQSWRRHLPPLLFMFGLALMLFALSRPAMVISMPTSHQTVILALDISGSMRATDLQPTRLAAAQAAARAFIEAQPSSTRIGIVSFAGTASLVQAPTGNREDLSQALDRLQPQRGTAIGSAIVVSLATIFPGAGIDLKSVGQRPAAPDGNSTREDRRDAARKSPAQTEPVPAGSFESAVIVLMSDGQANTGPDPVAAAKLAADRGVRLYTVGIGSTKGEVLRTDGWSMRVGLDEASLKTIADITRGEYFQAASSDELKRVYASMNSRFVVERKELEVGALFAGAGLVMLLIAAALSVAWYGRIL
jgi:Ca-activated chloride channel family protein